MTEPLWISFSVGLASVLLSLPFAVATVWVLERTRWWGRGLLRVAVMLPLVLPPAVTGYLLLWVFSPRRPLGAALAALGIPVAFQWLGAVVAAAVVGFPLLVLGIGLAMKAIDPRLETMSLSLGRSAWETFWRITFPLALPGVLSGCVLALARGLGEFGATIVLAGRIPGETETLSLAIYAYLEDPAAGSEVALLVGISVTIAVAAVAGAGWLDQRHRQRLELEP